MRLYTLSVAATETATLRKALAEEQLTESDPASVGKDLADMFFPEGKGNSTVWDLVTSRFFDSKYGKMFIGACRNPRFAQFAEQLMSSLFPSS